MKCRRKERKWDKLRSHIIVHISIWMEHNSSSTVDGCFTSLCSIYREHRRRAPLQWIEFFRFAICTYKNIRALRHNACQNCFNVTSSMVECWSIPTLFGGDKGTGSAVSVWRVLNWCERRILVGRNQPTEEFIHGRIVMVLSVLLYQTLQTQKHWKT